MSLFLITFLTLYGSMHAYAFLRLSSAYHPARAGAYIIRLLFVLMTVAPLLIRLCEWNGFARSATTIAWIGYVWMGTLFLLCSALLATDIVRMAGWGICRMSGSDFPILLGARHTFNIALVLSLSATIYSFFEARNINTEQFTVTTTKLPPSSGRIRIVQISDVHLGLLVRECRLKSILAQVKVAKPDILVSTGDLLDGRLNRQGTLDVHGELAQMLASIKAPLGKFAVTGNHEFYAGIDQAIAFTTKSGFRMLRGATAAAGPLSFTGVDDPAVLNTGGPAGLPESTLLRAVERGRFKILLKHRPEIDQESDGLFDLQLSGHAHKGQIFPFTLLVRLKYPVIEGTATTAAGALLHVSRGSGTWGPPLRFMAPPEVTIIDIVPAD